MGDLQVAEAEGTCPAIGTLGSGFLAPPWSPGAHTELKGAAKENIRPYCS